MEKANHILVCAHKPVTIKASSFYLPIEGGSSIRKNHLGLLRDDVDKDNISSKNPYYSELTALYYGWKHLNYDYLGLVHYRRYLKGKETIIVNNQKIKVLSEEQCNKILKDYDVILPNKRKYYIETLYNHYRRTLKEEPLIATEKVLKEHYPEYVEEFNKLKKRTSAHMFNMMVGNKSFLDGYLTFLFGVLRKVEDEIDSSGWTEYEKRYLGSISELMMDVYVNKHQVKYKEIKFKELIKFATLKKAYGFLMAKFFKKKYKKSCK